MVEGWLIAFEAMEVAMGCLGKKHCGVEPVVRNVHSVQTSARENIAQARVFLDCTRAALA